MKKVLVVTLCLFCLFVSIAIGLKGYTDYGEYRQDHTEEEFGKDLLLSTSDWAKGIQGIKDTFDKVNKFFTEWIPNTFTQAIERMQNALNYVTQGFDELWNLLKNWWKKLWDSDYNDGGSGNGGDGNGGSGFGGGGGGFGGGEGGFRDLKEAIWNL